MTRVPLTEETFRDQAIDYLDDLLNDEEREAFVEACRNNPAWENYVKELGSTWRRASRMLQKTQQPAPAHVMKHVMAEAEKRASLLRATTVPAMPAVTSSSVRLGLPTRLKAWLGRPWLAPALVATAALGIYVFSQKTWEAARPQSAAKESIEQESRPAPAMEADPRAASPAPTTVPDDAQKERKPEPKRRVARARGEGPAKPEQPKRTPSKAEGAKGDVDGVVDEPRVPSHYSTGKGYAAPPEGWGEVAQKKAAADDQARARSVGATAGQASRLAPAPMVAPRPMRAPAPPAAAPASPGQGFMGAREAEESAAADVEVSAPARDVANANAPALSRGDLVKKATFAETNGDWRTAADTYQELLQRFPRDKEAVKWKQRLAFVKQQMR